MRNVARVRLICVDPAIVLLLEKRNPVSFKIPFKLLFTGRQSKVVKRTDLSRPSVRQALEHGLIIMEEIVE